MSDLDALRRIDLQVRPLGATVVPGRRARAQFRAAFRQTATLLLRELTHLDATRIVIELDYRDRDLRLDGWPRADARMQSAAVAVAFESRHGPLRYATGEYDDWRDNVRAIALAMEALRAVDRYGVSKRGEQYQGWKALPQSTDPVDRITTEDQALAVIARYCGGEVPDDLERGVRLALRETHPDTGGDADGFREVMRAKEVLDAAGLIGCP